MKYTYINADNTSTNGTALGVEDQDITVFQIHFGNAANSEYVELHNIVNPVAAATGNLVGKWTQPSAIGAGFNALPKVDFGPKGVRLGEGGNVVTNANNVTVVWDLTTNVK